MPNVDACVAAWLPLCSTPAGISRVGGKTGHSMTLRTFFTVLAVLSFLFGIGFVLAPGQVLANYGIETTAALALVGRLFGGVLRTLSVILWLAKDFRDEAAVRAVLLGALLGDVVDLVVATMGTLSGTSNALGWSTVVIYLYGTLGSGYFLMTRTSRLSPR
jgi:hypothetical protein